MTINYLGKVFSTNIEDAKSTSETEEALLVKLISYKDVADRKMAIINQLSQEICDTIEYDAKYQEEMEKCMDDEVKLAEHLNILSSDIQKIVIA